MDDESISAMLAHFARARDPLQVAYPNAFELVVQGQQCRRQQGWVTSTHPRINGALLHSDAGLVLEPVESEFLSRVSSSHAPVARSRGF